MKVLALNGSPRLKASATYHMLEHLLAGMEEAGAETEIIHVRKLDLKACIGCYTCWVRTPGECIFDDSMGAAIAKYNTADLVVFGTPLYHFSMTGILKDFIDRTLVRLEPWLIPHPDLPDTSFHPERFHKPEKMMLVSPCGFPEFQHFDSLVATFRQMASMERMEYLGEVLRPGAEVLSRRSHQDLFVDYYALLKRAGSELIREGGISAGLQEALREDLFPGGTKAFYGLAENYWTQQMDRFKVPEEQRHTVPILASDLDSVPFVGGVGTEAAQPRRTDGRIRVTNQHLLQYLAGMFNPQAMPDLSATIQFNFSSSAAGEFDAGPDRWYLKINEGSCTVHEGATAVPSLVINTPNETWQDIGTGKLNAETAFTEGMFEAEGSMRLLGQFPMLFQYPQPREGGGVDPELDMLMLGMPIVFDAGAAGDLSATVEFVLGGSGGGIYHVVIAAGECSAHRESPVHADLTINAPAETWVQIASGELEGQAAFMAGDMRATGDMELMMRFSELFPTGKATAGDTAAEEVVAEPVVAVATGKSCRDTIQGMADRFNGQAAGDLAASIQFNVSGKEPGTYGLHIVGGKCKFEEGAADTPTLTIDTPSEVWLAISGGQLEGQKAFMESQYTADGDFALLMRMNDLFPKAAG